VGWSNQGQNDMRNLPAGYQSFARVGYFVSAPKSAVVLCSANAENTGLPKEVLGIPVNRPADALFFLHAMAWWGLDVWQYRVNYADGTSVEIPIRGERHVLDWFTDPVSWTDELARHNTVAAWTGTNGIGQKVTVYCYEWQNPHPEKDIRTVDFVTDPKSGYAPVPILVGLTAATLHANDGTVEDVLGAKGVRVRAGSRTVDVAYIGLTGIPKEHAFYAEAVEKHKAMVMGKKVKLVDDALLKNKDGQRLCYVHLGTNAPAMDTMVNAMLIGEGLSDTGEYEANNKQRAYFENLKFIAEQSQRGMWR
jgi:endonuclease YncB( thermonuclease family)